MKKIATTALAILTWCASLNMAHAYTITIQPDPFWSSYYAARDGFNESFNGSMDFQAQEAMINAYRQAHGLPRCSLALFPLSGAPRC